MPSGPRALFATWSVLTLAGLAASGCGDPPTATSEQDCGDGVDEDGDGMTDCADPDCAGRFSCAGDEVCDNSLDDDDDGRIDCWDPDCMGHPACREICDNGTDDDLDGLPDCLDAECQDHPACQGGDGDVDGDGDGDVDGDVDGDGDGDLDADGPATCPDDMVAMPGQPVCIDRYEASSGEGGAARSAVGELPWVRVDQSAAAMACRLAGKRLCSDSEWTSACRGSSELAFPYGDIFEPGRCNDAYLGLDAVSPAGNRPRCEGGLEGLFDMSGNAKEWTEGCPEHLCLLHGGSYRNNETELGCDGFDDVGPGTQADNVGFRCCLTL